MKRLIFHVDVNSAFLSWESTRRVQNGESDLRLVPAVVGGDPAKRTSIVTARSIPAKKFGIQTAEPMSMAMRKCPQLVWVKPDFKLYQEYSRAFKKICADFSPSIESFSIDEVFIDMTGMEKLFPNPIETAYKLKDRIRDELGFTVNVGVAENKLCAKMASDFEKPDKVHTLFPDEIEKKMWPLPIGDLFGVGKSSASRLKNHGILTVGDLAKTDKNVVKMLLGEKMGEYAYRAARGIDDSPVSPERDEAKSYGVETTLEDDLTDVETINRIFLSEADVVSARIRRDGARCGCITVIYKSSDFKQHSHQKKLSDMTDVTMEIYEVACQLFKESWDGSPLRLLGISLSDIDRDDCEQLSLFTDEKREKQKKLDSALSSIRDKYGNSSVKRASIMNQESNRRRNI